MPDYTELVKSIKKAAVDAVNEGDPTDICYGTVLSASPIQIQLNQKLTLGSAQLKLCRNVTTYSTTETISWDTETSDDHTHSITGTKTVTVNNALAAGDIVVMIKVQGGQEYVVIDKVG